MARKPATKPAAPRRTRYQVADTLGEASAVALVQQALAGNKPLPASLKGAARTLLWDDHGDQALVHVDSVVVRFVKRFAFVSVELETEQTGRAALIVTLAFGSTQDGAGLYAATDQLGLVAGLGYSKQDRSDGPGEDGTSWLLGAHYAWGEATTLRASASRQVRYPTLRDLYAVDRGNPALTPETTDTYELAWRQDLAAGPQFEAVLFHIDADDFIERPLTGGLVQNFEAYQFQGVEVTLASRAAGPFDWSVGYTWTDSENQSSGADIETLQNRPEHKFALRADYEFAGGWRVGGTWLYVADSYTLSRTTPTTAQELGDYNVLDLDVSFEFGGNARVYARIENALDELYEESFGFPQDGRTLVLGAEVKL